MQATWWLANGLRLHLRKPRISSLKQNVSMKSPTSTIDSLTLGSSKLTQKVVICSTWAMRLKMALSSRTYPEPMGYLLFVTWLQTSPQGISICPNSEWFLAPLRKTLGSLVSLLWSWIKIWLNNEMTPQSLLIIRPWLRATLCIIQEQPLPFSWWKSTLSSY